MVLLSLIQLFVGLLVLYGNAWVPAVIAFVVYQEQTLVKCHSVGFYLFLAQSESRSKLTHQSRLLRYGNLPDAEEAQNMIYAIGVKVLGHLAETAYPPRAAVFQHLVPIVGGEAPVLSVGRERIGWGTSLTVQVEILWFYPSLHTITADADGDVTL